MAYTPVPSNAEDSPHTSGDLGIPILTVRNDAVLAADLADTTGDYQLLQSDGSGNLRVAQIKPASTVTLVDFSTISDATRVLTILAANLARRSGVVSNDTDATLYLKEGAAASLTSYTDILPPGCRYLLETSSILTAYVPNIPNGRLLVTERV